MRAMFKKFFAKFRIGLCYLLFALANIVFAAVIGICLILSLFGLRDYKKKINAALRIIVRLLSITIFPSVGGYFLTLYLPATAHAETLSGLWEKYPTLSAGAAIS